MVKTLPLFIDGKQVVSKTQKFSDAYDPSTGEVIAKVPCCTAEKKLFRHGLQLRYKNGRKYCIGSEIY